MSSAIRVRRSAAALLLAGLAALTARPASAQPASSLIPTVLTVEAPAGITVEAITYPPPTELTQAGRRDTLAVLGPEFAIDVQLSVAATAAAGDLAVPAVLRYQACNDTVCFPPARATATWALQVQP